MRSDGKCRKDAHENHLPILIPFIVCAIFISYFIFFRFKAKFMNATQLCIKQCVRKWNTQLTFLSRLPSFAHFSARIRLECNTWPRVFALVYFSSWNQQSSSPASREQEENSMLFLQHFWIMQHSTDGEPRKSERYVYGTYTQPQVS